MPLHSTRARIANRMNAECCSNSAATVSVQSNAVPLRTLLMVMSPVHILSSFFQYSSCIIHATVDGERRDIA
jgi:hypothetical protein